MELSPGGEGGDEAKGWGGVYNVLGKPILKFVLQFVFVGIKTIAMMLGCILYSINLNFYLKILFLYRLFKRLWKVRAREGRASWSRIGCPPSRTPTRSQSLIKGRSGRWEIMNSWWEREDSTTSWSRLNSCRNSWLEKLILNKTADRRYFNNSLLGHTKTAGLNFLRLRFTFVLSEFVEE